MAEPPENGVRIVVFLTEVYFSSTVNTLNSGENCPIWNSSTYLRLLERGTITKEPNMGLFLTEIYFYHLPSILIFFLKKNVYELYQFLPFSYLDYLPS